MPASTENLERAYHPLPPLVTTTPTPRVSRSIMSVCLLFLYYVRNPSQNAQPCHNCSTGSSFPDLADNAATRALKSSTCCSIVLYRSLSTFALTSDTFTRFFIVFRIRSLHQASQLSRVNYNVILFFFFLRTRIQPERHHARRSTNMLQKIWSSFSQSLLALLLLKMNI